MDHSLLRVPDASGSLVSLIGHTVPEKPTVHGASASHRSRRQLPPRHDGGTKLKLNVHPTYTTTKQY